MTEQPFANLVQVLHLLKNILPGRFLVDCHELDKLWSLKNTLSAFIFLSWLQDISVEGSSTHPSPCKEESAEWKREKQELKHQRVENNQRQNGNDQIIIYRRWRNWNNGVVASLSAQEPRSVADTRLVSIRLTTQAHQSLRLPGQMGESQPVKLGTTNLFDLSNYQRAKAGW